MVVKKLIKKTPKAPKTQKVKRWFRTVVSDFKNVDDSRSVDLVDNIVDYYLFEIETGYKEITNRGNLAMLVQQSSGLHAYYNAMANDIVQVRLWLEMKSEHATAAKYKWFMQSPEAAKKYGKGLKVTDIRNYIKCEDDMVAYDMIIREISDIQHQMESIVENLEIRGMSLSQVVKLKVAGIEDVWVDLSKETNND